MKLRCICSTWPAGYSEADVHAHAPADPPELDYLVSALFESGLSLTFTSCAHATWAFLERVEIFSRYLTIETAEMDRVKSRRTESPCLHQDFSALGRELGYAAIDANFIAAVLGRSSGRDWRTAIVRSKLSISAIARAAQSSIVNRKSSIDGFPLTLWLSLTIF
jgi:hypothetical protein